MNKSTEPLLLRLEMEEVGRVEDVLIHQISVHTASGLPLIMVDVESDT